jgi:hypothetical protein
MKRDGFGLVEILISSSLLVFLIGGTAQLLMVSLAAKASGDFAFAAARCGSALLERDKSLPFDSPELAPGISHPAVEDGAFPARLQATRRVEDIEGGMKRIIVIVSDRHSPQKRQTYCLTLCRELGF